MIHYAHTSIAKNSYGMHTDKHEYQLESAYRIGKTKKCAKKIIFALSMLTSAPKIDCFIQWYREFKVKQKAINSSSAKIDPS